MVSVTPAHENFDHQNVVERIRKNPQAVADKLGYSLEELQRYYNSLLKGRGTQT